MALFRVSSDTTLQTTIKYIYIILQADNRGEGGILALYALVRKRKKGLFAIAIIGASALLADGILTLPLPLYQLLRD
ncbi:MAG: KUP/HAK/KT family potassium transporter [Bacteroidales bacterium]